MRSWGRAESDSSPDELETSLLAGEDPGREPQHGAGVAEVERALRLAQTAQADSANANRLRPVLVHLGAELANHRDRRLRVRRAPEALDHALAVGDRPQQDGALRDPLHAGHGDGALDRRRRLDLHSSRTGETTTP